MASPQVMNESIFIIPPQKRTGKAQRCNDYLRPNRLESSAATGRRTGKAQRCNDLHRPARLESSAATRRRIGKAQWCNDLHRPARLDWPVGASRHKKRGPLRPRFLQQEKRRGKNEKERKLSILYKTPVPLLGRLFAFRLIFMALLYLSIVKEKSEKILSSY